MTVYKVKQVIYVVPKMCPKISLSFAASPPQWSIPLSFAWVSSTRRALWRGPTLALSPCCTPSSRYGALEGEWPDCINIPLSFLYDNAKNKRFHLFGFCLLSSIMNIQAVGTPHSRKCRCNVVVVVVTGSYKVKSAIHSWCQLFKRCSLAPGCAASDRFLAAWHIGFNYTF